MQGDRVPTLRVVLEVDSKRMVNNVQENTRRLAGALAASIARFQWGT